MADSGDHHLFNPVKLLEPPCVTAPLKLGKISIALQFVVPGLRISEKEKENYKNLIKNSLEEVWDSEVKPYSTKEIGLPLSGTLITVAFYIKYLDDDIKRHQVIQNRSRILIERFLGVVSYCAGAKVSAKNIITTITWGSSNAATLRPSNKIEHPRKFSMPREIYDKKISDEIYTAMFWLRRGLADSDPIDNFNAFTICLQILARDWWNKKNSQSRAPMPTPTKLLRDYVITELSGNPDTYEKVWKKRNAITAHGNKLNIDADDFTDLTELKFEAAIWAYQGVNLALGLGLGEAQRPRPNFFVTDALMNLD
jgi:hypothetical protein